ncbi:MAG: energy transducer TonB [Desulfuromonadales bacterium]|nr:energy transducer TonB [Desulfuromonadales bacterium]
MPAAVDEPKSESSQKIPSHEMVCKLPQDVAFDRLPVPLEFEDSLTGAGEPIGAGTASAVASQETPLALMQGDDKGVLGSPVSSSPAFIEAVPEYRSNPLPEYPRLARQRHWQGVVWLMVNVSADGLVENLQIEQSCGHQVLDRAARRSVNSWRFSPAKRDGLPVSSQVRIPVRFVLEGS